MTVTRFCFRCPLPPRLVSQNGRPSSPYQRARETADYQQLVAAYARGQSTDGTMPRFERARLDLTFIVPDRIRRDVGNYIAAFQKAGCDALVAVGLLADDDSTHLVEVTGRMRRAAPVEEPGVLVQLIRITEEGL